MTDLLLNSDDLKKRLAVMAEEISRLVPDPDEAAIIGIRTRGAVLAKRIHKILALEHEWNLPLGILDITLYRDDLSQLASHPLVHKTHLDFDVTNRTIILIDDVLYTGRTIRSAIDEIIDFGRPKAIRLAVLVDRGGREYPIQADYAAMKIDIPNSRVVHVLVDEIDGDEKLIVTDRPDISDGHSAHE